MKGWVFLGLTSTKLRLMCLAQEHNAVTPVRLKPAATRTQVKHSTTEPLSSHKLDVDVEDYLEQFGGLHFQWKDCAINKCDIVSISKQT